MISILEWPYSVNVKFFRECSLPHEGRFYEENRKTHTPKKNTFAGFLQSGSQLMTYFSFLAELGLSLCNL